MSSHEQYLENYIKPITGEGRVLEAFRQVDRAKFVPAGIECKPYSDDVIVLGSQSTISAPQIVASMIELLDIQESDVILEVGAASGYSAAVMSLLAREVHTVDINSRLTNQAQANLGRLGIENAYVYTGDGLNGIPGGGGFTKAVLTAAAKSAPTSLLDQLSGSGILLAPIVRNFPEAMMVKYSKSTSGEISSDDLFPCRFVPLVSERPGGHGEDELSDIEEQAKRLRVREYVKEKLTERWTRFGRSYQEEIYEVRKEMTQILGLDEIIPEEDVLDLIGVGQLTFSPSGRAAPYTQKAEDYLE